MKYKNPVEDKDYKIGEIIKYIAHEKEIHALFLRRIDEKFIEVVLIDNKLTEGIKVIIYKNQIKK